MMILLFGKQRQNKPQYQMLLSPLFIYFIVLLVLKQSSWLQTAPWESAGWFLLLGGTFPDLIDLL